MQFSSVYITSLTTRPHNSFENWSKVLSCPLLFIPLLICPVPHVVIIVCTKTGTFQGLSQPTVQAFPDVDQGNTEEIVSLLHFLTILSVHDRLETRALRDIITSGFQMIMRLMKTKLPDVTPLVIPFLITAVVLHDYAAVACIMDNEVETVWSWSIHTSGCQMIRAGKSC